MELSTIDRRKLAKISEQTTDFFKTLKSLQYQAREKRRTQRKKAFLTKEGKQIIADREEDFKLICQMKKEDSYIFTSDSTHDQMLRRESLTRSITQILKQVSSQLLNNPRITSHIFRSGYITQLWKDTKDIEFVRQAIGDSKLESTSSYIENLTDAERQKRLFQT
jgi:site-specific recombinase XerD